MTRLSHTYPSNPDHFQQSAPPSAPPSYGQFPTASIPVQPTQYNVETNTPGIWSTGLCDCFSDVSNCCITCWCPCITFGQIAEIIDKGSTSCGASGALYVLICCVTGFTCLYPCAWIYSCFYRSKMRQQYMLQESPCNDCLIHCFCEGCALCQEYRELKNRGFDMTLGWHGTIEKQNGGVTMAPVVQGGMYR